MCITTLQFKLDLRTCNEVAVRNRQIFVVSYFRFRVESEDGPALRDAPEHPLTILQALVIEHERHACSRDGDAPYRPASARTTKKQQCSENIEIFLVRGWCTLQRCRVRLWCEL